MDFYAAQDGSSVPTFRDHLSVPSSRSMVLDFLTLEEETGRLFRNVGAELPSYAT